MTRAIACPPRKCRRCSSPFRGRPDKLFCSRECLVQSMRATAARNCPVGACVECGAVRALKPRALCWRCYHDPAARDRHAPAVRGPGEPPLPGLDDPDPCPYPPGTPEKVAWLACRVAAGYHLFHPHDCRPGDPQ